MRHALPSSQWLMKMGWGTGACIHKVNLDRLCSVILYRVNACQECVTDEAYNVLVLEAALKEGFKNTSGVFPFYFCFSFCLPPLPSMSQLIVFCFYVFQSDSVVSSCSSDGESIIKSWWWWRRCNQIIEPPDKSSSHQERAKKQEEHINFLSINWLTEFSSALTVPSIITETSTRY